MLRNRAVALFLSCTASSLAFALGLGSLESDSSLNEPFSGRIDILGAAPEDFDTLTVTLADAEQFARAGIERNPALFGLRFAIDDSVPGEDFIRVTSKDPIREPYLNFLVELNWANGRLVREYTVLLDPPLYDPDRRRAVFAPAPAAPATAAAPAPAPAAIPATPPAAPPAAALPAATGGYAAGREIGPVVATDTLWSIASAARPHDGITVQQMMLALLRANPGAFGEDNVNLLRRGAVLRLPAQEELTAMDARAAYAEVQRHNQLWERYRGQVAAEPETQPVGAAAPSTAFDLDDLDEDSARLELVAPGDAEGGSTPGRAGEGGGAELLREEVEARAQQAAELESKLVEAEGIIDLLQRQVNIKDEELAALQARLAELGVAQDELGLEERAEALADDAREALAELDEAVPEVPDVDPGMTLDDAFGDDLLDEEPVVEEAAPEADTAPAEPAAAAAPAEKAAEPAPAKPEPAPKKAAPKQPERAFPANLVPEHIAALVPGGSLTILGAGALLVLGIIIGLVTSVMRRRGGKAETPAAAAPAAAAATMPPAEEEDASEAPTEVGASDVTEEPTSFDPNATVESEADETPEEFLRTQTDVAPPPAAEQEEDPLEEVNVYLAYERFDQAEELVKRVIAEHPDRHEYKLRLLEVYYSSNDRAAYENAARDLLDAVGEDDPLWSSALAMWAEMSPERALFAEGVDEAAASAADTGPAFVDITAEGEAESPAESTLVQAPGDDDDNALDFDLTGTGEDEGAASADAADDMFDITAAADDEVLDLTAGDDADVLDLTAAADDDDVLDLTAAADDDVLDLTAGDEGEAADAAFDLSGTPDSAADEDVLDITGGGDSGETLKLEGDGAAGVHDLDSLEDTHDPANDLLDVTSSGKAGDFDDDNLLDLGGSLAGDGAEALDFDISDTVAPVTGSDDETGDDEASFDITGGEDDTDLLDFDIGGFDEEESAGDPAFDTESTAELGAGGTADTSLDISDDLGEAGELDLELTRGMDEVTTRLDVTENEGDDGGLEITMSTPGGDAPDGELSLQGDELDELSLGGDDEFDLSLENTSDMDSIAAEETMEIPAGGLNLATGEDDLGDFELDLPLPGEDETGGSSGDDGHTDTVELAGGDALEIDPDEHSTVVLPKGADVERQSSIDEADTKLNLAKAYIELGDNEGARSILAEVVSDGSDAQKAEAQGLLDQMSD